MKQIKLKDIETARRDPLEVNDKLSYLHQWHDPRFVKWVKRQDIIEFKNKVYMLFLLCQSLFLVQKGILTPNSLKTLLYTAYKTILIKDGMQWKIFSQRSSYAYDNVHKGVNSCCLGFQQCISLGIIKRVCTGEHSYAHAVDFYKLRSLLYKNGINTNYKPEFLDKASKDYELNYETVCRLFYENIGRLLSEYTKGSLILSLGLFKQCILNKEWVCSNSFNGLGKELGISVSAVIKNLQKLRNLQVVDIREGAGIKKNIVFAPGDVYLSENNKILEAGESYKELSGLKKSSLEDAILSLNTYGVSKSWDFSDSRFINLVKDRGENFYRNTSNLNIFGSIDNLKGKWDKAEGAYGYLAAAEVSQLDTVKDILYKWFIKVYGFSDISDLGKLHTLVKDGLKNFLRSNWYERKSILYAIDRRVCEKFEIKQVYFVSPFGYKSLCEIYLEFGLIVDNSSLIDKKLSNLEDNYEYYKRAEESKKLAKLSGKSLEVSKRLKVA